MRAERASNRRLVSRAEAARYCSMSVPAFDRLCPVRAIAFGTDRRLHRFDVVALDRWIDRLDLQNSATVSQDQAAWLAGLDNDDHGSR